MQGALPWFTRDLCTEMRPPRSADCLQDEQDRAQDYFFSRRRWFFGFVALTESLDVVDTLIKGEDHLRSLGLEYLPRIGIFILLCAVAATTRNLRFHALFVFAGLAYEISFFGRYYGTLN
jgi:hypothetical protein